MQAWKDEVFAFKCGECGIVFSRSFIAGVLIVLGVILLLVIGGQQISTLSR